MKTGSTFALVLIALTGPGLCQDIHWSQPTGPLLYQNAAFAGITGQYYAAACYRDQWNSIGQTYRTALISADYRFRKDEGHNGVSAGICLLSDNMAGGAFRQTTARGAISYQLYVNESVKIAGGFYYSYIQSSLFTDPYTWGSQFNGQNYDPTLPGEPITWGRKNTSSVGFGAAWHFDADPTAVSYYSSAKWLAGYSLDHLNRPDAGMYGAAEILRMRHSLFLSGFIPGGDNNGLKPVVTAYLQGPAIQVTGGLLVRYSLGQISRYTGIRQGSAMCFGVLYRTVDAVIPTIEYERGNFLAGLSYDITVSRFRTGNNFRGGFELSLRLRAPSNYLYKEKKSALFPSTRTQQ